MDVKMIEVDGRTLRVGVRRWAEGTVPILLFNGIWSPLELFRPFADRLGELGCIAFDVPGVGGSPLPAGPYRLADLCRLSEQLLGALGVEGPVDVLGISWGGGPAQEFAHRHPERCRRLILAATTAGMVMVPGKLGTIAKFARPGRDLLIELGADPRALAEAARGRPLPPGTPLGFLYQMMAAVGWTSVHWLHRLKQPTLVLAGTEDPLVRPVNARMLAALIPGARLHMVAGGHMFLFSRLAELMPVIREFLGHPP